MWELDHKEGWAPKNWCFWNLVLEKALESPLDSKEIKPVNPKGNQPWIFIGRTDAEAEALILWPPDGKSWLIGKDSDAREGGDRGWDGWMASLTRWTWANSGRQRRTGKPGMLQSMGVTKNQTWLSDWTHKQKFPKVPRAAHFPLISFKEVVSNLWCTFSSPSAFLPGIPQPPKWLFYIYIFKICSLCCTVQWDLTNASCPESKITVNADQFCGLKIPISLA